MAKNYFLIISDTQQLGGIYESLEDAQDDTLQGDLILLVNNNTLANDEPIFCSTREFYTPDQDELAELFHRVASLEEDIYGAPRQTYLEFEPDDSE